MAARYDAIGRTYTATRATEPRIAARIWAALGDARTVVNVGAGTGNYEPPDREVTAVEPSAVMIAQRPPGAAPAVQASAEALPFADASFDAAMAVLTLHHWSDWRGGCAELRRVARDRVVVFSWDPTYVGRMWLGPEYFPERVDGGRRAGFPSLADQAAALGAEVEVVPVPWDCRDGFFSAFWRRPEAYLDPAVRAGISTLAKRSEAELADGLARLRADLDSGAWARRHADLLRARRRSTSATACSSARAGGRHARGAGTRVRRDLSVPEGGPMPQPKSSSSRARKPARGQQAGGQARRHPQAGRQERGEQAGRQAQRGRASRRPSAPPRRKPAAATAKADRRRHREPHRAARHAAQGRRPHRRRRQGRARRRRQARADHAQGRHGAQPDAALRGRAQADGFRSDLEQLLGRGRSQAVQSSDRVLREVDRARRRVGVGSVVPDHALRRADRGADPEPPQATSRPRSCARCATTRRATTRASPCWARSRRSSPELRWGQWMPPSRRASSAARSSS